MIATTKRQNRKSKSPAWHGRFLAMLPSIRGYARHKFRSVPQDARDEFTQEVIANCFRTYRRLVELGKEDLAFPTALAQFATKQVRAGRRVAGTCSPRDVMSELAQRRKGFVVGRLDGFDPIENQWHEIVVEDKRATPAEIAVFWIDFATWLKLLSKRERKIALVLASGERTSAVADKFGVTAARISQLRLWLNQSWERFQGEVDSNPAELAVAR